MEKPFIKLSIKNYSFSCTFFPILVFLGLFLLLINLGIWQLQRGKEKQAIQQQFTARSHNKAIVLNQATAINASQKYSPVILLGHFDNQHTYLLDNKIYQHQIGYEVLTPFILKYGTSTILVNRGWIPQGKSRNSLPFIKPIQGNMTIQGLLVWPQKTFSFKTTAETQWPRRIQILTPEFLSQQKLKPFIVIINKTGFPYGFTCLWQPMTLSPSRHYAYALQWFSLSLLLVIAFFITHIHALKG
jgi:surfeit locus 1 family protein